MAFQNHKNFAFSLVATAPSPASSGTSLIVTAGEGTVFPTAPFQVTIWPSGVRPTRANAEICQVTVVSTDTLTITRAQESSSARAIVIGDNIAATITVLSLTDIEALAPNSSIVSTTGNITALALPTGTGALTIYLTNASLATIQGIGAGISGQRLTLISQGAGQLDLANNNASGTTLGKLHNIATSGNTPLAAGVGIATFIYDVTNTRWNLVEHEQGAWITPTYAAGNYAGGSPQTWTVDAGDVALQKYWLRGRTLSVAFALNTTSVGGAPSTQLFINRAACGGFQGISATVFPDLFVRVIDNGGTPVPGRMIVYQDATILLIIYSTVAGVANWTAATNTTQVAGSVQFEVL